jgi:hypothetical protein
MEQIISNLKGKKGVRLLSTSPEHTERRKPTQSHDDSPLRLVPQASCGSNHIGHLDLEGGGLLRAVKEQSSKARLEKDQEEWARDP